MVLELRSGFPRQLSVIKENRRCSILFHLLVPGGRWQTVMGIRNSLASVCSFYFPETQTSAVAAAAIGGDHQPAGLAMGKKRYPKVWRQY